MNRKKVVSCGAVPFRESVDIIEVLLIKQFKNRETWGCAKGHINEGETLEECALREVREETGINVTLTQRLNPVITVYGNEEKTVHCWLATPQDGQVLCTNDPDCEIAEARWWNIDELPAVHPYQLPLVKQAIDLIRNKSW